MYAPNTPPQPEYWVLSLSGGKDSTALGLEWLKRHQQDPVTYPLHEVICLKCLVFQLIFFLAYLMCGMETEWANLKPLFKHPFKTSVPMNC